ncbi:MAG: hypothetical protein ABIB61_02090 [Candidatus Shapirobacteria bacterium]
MINPEGKERQASEFDNILSGIDRKKELIDKEFQERRKAADSLVRVMDDILPKEGSSAMMGPFKFIPATLLKEGVTIERCTGLYPPIGERVLNYEVRLATGRSNREVFIVSRVNEETTVPLILDVGQDQYGRPMDKFRIASVEETEGVREIVSKL